MRRRPFDIKFRSEIESNRYNVVTRDGRSVKVVYWDGSETEPVIGVINGYAYNFTKDGRQCINGFSPSNSDLFVITDEPDLPFNIGDYICFHDGSTPSKVIDIYEDQGRYEVDHLDGTRSINRIDDFQKHYHVWTIKDAKPGDILDTDIVLLIYKGSNESGDIHSYCYFSQLDKSFNIETSIISPTFVHPTTSDRKTTLLNKISESGYHWNSESLRLTKIKEGDAELENLLLDYYEMIKSSDHEYKEEITNEYSEKIIELVKKKLMKDLPIWHNVKKAKGSDKKDYAIVGYYLVKRGYGIYLKDLEKLPREE